MRASIVVYHTGCSSRKIQDHENLTPEETGGAVCPPNDRVRRAGRTDAVRPRRRLAEVHRLHAAGFARRADQAGGRQTHRPSKKRPAWASLFCTPSMIAPTAGLATSGTPASRVSKTLSFPARTAAAKSEAQARHQRPLSVSVSGHPRQRPRERRQVGDGSSARRSATHHVVGLFRPSKGEGKPATTGVGIGFAQPKSSIRRSTRAWRSNCRSRPSILWPRIASTAIRRRTTWRRSPTAPSHIDGGQQGQVRCGRSDRRGGKHRPRSRRSDAA